MKTKDLIYCALFCTLIIIGAFLKISIPPLPMFFTMQTFFVILSGYVLDAKRSTVSVSVYILLGLIGIPVFSTGGGISYILSPTFGFLIGFIPASYVISKLTVKKIKFYPSLIAVAMIYTVGILYFILIKNVYLAESISALSFVSTCLVFFVPFDILSAFFSYVLSKRIKRSKII